MTLTPEQKALYRGQLAEAEAALHQLVIGKSAVTLSYNGESITYKIADEARLRNYIRELQAKLGIIRSARRPGVRA
ncbi:gpW family head-tail joining protein [Sinorhizobium meliloti]|uniref:gpW family head-tail joining protein n=1 Tax=Rhizobium meliloti TaxID=382 RepID=UPI0013E2F7FB|nr:gpW family head-tail joining protein [Sinorhizobium meliloti]MCM5689145.1 gpW family protein [Sinorhizobium meliloti]MCO6425441.1 gpW family protein [Sinorhizobium meliloti]